MHRPPIFTMEQPFLALRDALPVMEAEQSPSYRDKDERRQAAVSLVLRKNHDFEALLIRRAEADGDPWSGHIALPGGRRDASDPDLFHTARRETFEETGVPLDQVGVSLGILDPLLPSNRQLPPLAIFPFVFAVPPTTRTQACTREVDEVFWAPLPRLFSPAAEGTVPIQIGEKTRHFPCFRIDGRVIWGLTYRIFKDFLRRLEEHAPEILENPEHLSG